MGAFIDPQQLSRELMDTAEVAMLTTIGAEGFPETRAMFNLRRRTQFPGLVHFFAQHQADFLVYFTTNTSSRKLTQLARNPRASVYYSRPADWRGLNLVGSLEVVSDPGLKERLWQEGWELYYPAGPQDPDYTVLRLKPQFGRYYHQLQVSTWTFPGESQP